MSNKELSLKYLFESAIALLSSTKCWCRCKHFRMQNTTFICKVEFVNFCVVVSKGKFILITNINYLIFCRGGVGVGEVYSNTKHILCGRCILTPNTPTFKHTP